MQNEYPSECVRHNRHIYDSGISGEFRGINLYNHIENTIKVARRKNNGGTK